MQGDAAVALMQQCTLAMQTAWVQVEISGSYDNEIVVIWDVVLCSLVYTE
jgi:hypothetical protein